VTARLPLQSQDTIVAIASAPGRGAVALVRLSGPDAFRIARRHVRTWPPQPRLAHLSEVFDGDNKVDEALITLFPAPHSYTGDDTVELSTHGGYLVPASIVAALISSGARQALPGEFTRRAVLNAKLDIIQAEAIGDLIDARSNTMQRTALAQLDGGLSRRLLQLRSELIDLEALIAYDLDFPEEDDGPIPPVRIAESIRKTSGSLERLLATASIGELVREGAVVVIAGPPNVGKSSLFNALLGKSRAIVTEIPGTTRDALEAVVDSGKWLLRLVDTAGIRETEDRIERMGIEVSEKYLANADIVLACAEQTQGIEQTTAFIGRHSSAPVIPVRTKSDLVANGEQSTGAVDALAVSAETGVGLKELIQAIDARLDQNQRTIEPDLPVLTRARHRSALETARNELQQFSDAWTSRRLPAAIAAVHLRAAVHALEELVGAVDIEDVLDRVFGSFCVGK
jgi:tRNA modification GTPase